MKNSSTAPKHCVADHRKFDVAPSAIMYDTMHLLFLDEARQQEEETKITYSEYCNCRINNITYSFIYKGSSMLDVCQKGRKKRHALFLFLVIDFLQLIKSSLAFLPLHLQGGQQRHRLPLNIISSSSVGDSSSTTKQQQQQQQTDKSEHEIFSTICQWTEDAIFQRGTSEGLQALKHLKAACDQRLPFDFDTNTNHNIQVVRQILPMDVTEEVSDIVKEMEADGCLSTNLDSVDGLPSFHLNLVSNGKPLFPKSKDTTQNIFGQNVQKLLDLVEPYIYNDLLPKVRELGHSQHIEVSDIFLRRYGQDGEDSRRGISAHYDVFSKVTTVIAMDNVADEGNNGLYTTAVTMTEAGKQKTSNHSSLRRFFPLQEGDGVLHSWDVLHGVDVQPGLDRTSLIVWFTEKSNIDISPWLVQDKERLEQDDVTQFVLASALESAQQVSGSHTAVTEDTATATATTSSGGGSVSLTDGAAMFQSMSQIESSPRKPKDPHNPQQWYLKSASQDNSFALARLGSICEAEEWTDAETQQQALDLLNRLCSADELPKAIQQASDFLSACQSMAWRFWFEAAVRGNPSAQLALADDLMVHAVNNDFDSDEDARLLATVLFSLAAQQGIEDAVDRLARVVEMEVQNSNIHTEREFQQNPVVQTAQAAMKAPKRR